MSSIHKRIWYIVIISPYFIESAIHTFSGFNCWLLFMGRNSVFLCDGINYYFFFYLSRLAWNWSWKSFIQAHFSAGWESCCWKAWKEDRRGILCIQVIGKLLAPSFSFYGSEMNHYQNILFLYLLLHIEFFLMKHTFQNNLGIKQKLTKYLKERCCLTFP